MRKSCECKADVVAADERESGIRAILNLGHTFGHAIEASMGYGAWLHGEAVSAGMIMACEMSVRLGWIDEEITRRAERVLARGGLPIRPPPSVTLEKFMTYMSVDKKVESGVLRLVLLKGKGHAVVTKDFSEEILFDTIMYYHQLFKKDPGHYEWDNPPH
jgi:3-dehydroquinate synthase